MYLSLVVHRVKIIGSMWQSQQPLCFIHITLEKEILIECNVDQKLHAI